MGRCSAKTRDGRPCRAHAIRGATVCGAHGGRAPQTREAAKRRLAAAAARKKLAELDVEPLGDPFEALEDLAAEAVALKGLLADRVAALEEVDGAKPAEVRAEMRAYTDSMDRAQRFAKDVAALGLDERRVVVSERLGAQIEAVLRAALSATFALLRERLGDGANGVLDEVERREVPGIVRAELLAAVPKGRDD